MPVVRNLVLFLALLLSACSSRYVPVNYEVGRYSVLPSDTLVQNKGVEKCIETYRAPIEAEMSEVIGHASQLLYRKRPESPLTNFVADLLLQNSKRYRTDNGKNIEADISLVNVYGFRNSIPEGAILRRTIYEVMPFDNSIVFVYLRGEQLRKLCQKIAFLGGEGVAGLNISIHNKKLKSVLVNGLAIKDTSLYCMVTSDYLAEGGGGLNLNKLADSVEQTSFLLRDAIMEEVIALKSENSSVSAKLDGRVYVE